MNRYFFAANFWLFIGLIVYVGRTSIQGQPDLCFIYGVGRVLDERVYIALLLGILTASLIYFLLWGVTARKNNSGSTH
jgi:hypothetical protein